MALLAHRTFAGLHFLTKWESRNVPLNATSELASFSMHASFVSRCLSHLQQPLRSCAHRSSGIRNCAAVNDAVAGMQSIDSTSVLTGAPIEARCIDESHSQAATSRHHSVPLPATQLRGWANGGGMVHEEARVHSSVFVEVGAVVQAGAVVEKEVRIGACSVVGHNVRLGERTVLW
jgi:acetyltransferase-like isoleucine patch superfamily enzyme